MSESLNKITDKILKDAAAEAKKIKTEFKKRAKEIEKELQKKVDDKKISEKERINDLAKIAKDREISQEEIRLTNQRFSKKEGKVVYILDSSGGGAATADLLIQLGVKVILANGAMSHLALNQLRSPHSTC